VVRLSCLRWGGHNSDGGREKNSVVDEEKFFPDAERLAYPVGVPALHINLAP
jgi:hypothetical protein